MRIPALALVLAAALPTAASAADVLFGLDNPTPAQWESWHQDLLRLRAEQRRAAGMRADREPAIYEDPSSAWSDASSRQVFIFVYDTSFIDRGQYKTREWLRAARARFGTFDSVQLWQAYPQLGYDTRNQFDFYKQLPGGLEGVKREVSDVLHAEGIRLFIDYNPWDAGASEAALAEMVRALDADGIMLDTMPDVPASLKEAVDRVKPGVVLVPERRPEDRELVFARQSWAQWYDVGDGSRPAILRQQWLLPRHRQFTIRRWDTDRKGDIVFSFFQGSGLFLWDNVFGSFNPYSVADQRLIAQTGVVLDAVSARLRQWEWKPLYPTGTPGLDQNLWTGPNAQSVSLYRNRTERVLTARAPRDGMAFWPEPRWVRVGDALEVAPQGTQALLTLERAELDALAAKFVAARLAVEKQAQADPGYTTVTPAPTQLAPPPLPPLPRGPAGPGFVELPAGRFTMKIHHPKRETGCYPEGAAPGAQWGWHYLDPLTHEIPVDLLPFAIKKTSVTNAEFVEFVHLSGYTPQDPARFLAQIPRERDGRLPTRLSGALAALPVTYVSLEDARAYAQFKGERLPSEGEWQWAAEGAGLARPWPWGDAAPDARKVNLTGRLAAAAAYPAGATAQGVLQMTGNAWEWTESEYADGHTRYVMLRGGVYLPAGGSEWLIARGARPNDFHARYLLTSEGMDRSEAVSFRTVR